VLDRRIPQQLHAQVAVQNQGFIPYSDEPINYRTAKLNDPIAKLQEKLDRGDARIVYEGKNGYLRSVLNALQIPANSQTLVFSKTSFQFRKISPQTPRALYFNDDVYVGWVLDGKALEFASFDPMQGAIFYLLDAEKKERPAFERAELDCTQCHIVSGTRGIPGVLLRSLFVTPQGTRSPGTEAYVTGQESPLRERWGGWYVTGSVGNQPHMGNTIVGYGEPSIPPIKVNEESSTSLVKRFESSRYLSSNSDVVAHLVLAHQTQMHDLITLTNYKTRLALYQNAHSKHGVGQPPEALPEELQAQYEQPAEELLRYLLFADEATLEAPIRGDSGFTEEFQSRGPRDSHGRSLRDFDLKTRLFKYPCSYLIYSESFDALPEPARTYVYHRLLTILSGQDKSADFARLAQEDRKAILEILLATKAGLPDEWRNYAKAAHLDTGYKSTRAVF
jgi:hypothetical protein